MASSRAFGIFTRDSGEDEEKKSQAGSVTGLEKGVYQQSFGVAIAGLQSALRLEWAVMFSELTAQVKIGIRLGLAGLQWVLIGAWGDSQRGVTTSVLFSRAGVALTVECVTSPFGARLC